MISTSSFARSTRSLSGSFDIRNGMNMLSTSERFWSLSVLASNNRKGTARHSKPDRQATKFVDQLLYLLYAGLVQEVLGLAVLVIERMNVMSKVLNCLPKSPWPHKIYTKYYLTIVGASRAPDFLFVTTRLGPRDQDGKELVVGGGSTIGLTWSSWWLC